MTIPTPPDLQRGIFQRHVATFKMLGIGFLTLLLLIPLAMIRSVLGERMERRNAAVEEITSILGKEQLLVGPILTVPFRYQFTTWKEEKVGEKIIKKEELATAIANAYFLPATLEVEGAIHPEKRYRGIYEAVVYRGDLRIKGTFTSPDPHILKVEPKDMLWEDSAITLAVPDLRGTQERLNLTWGNQTLPFEPGSKLDGFPSGIHTRIGLAKMTGDIPFEIKLTLRGSEGIYFTPVGVENRVLLSSSWPDPSFKGAFLPTERQVSAGGFKARWQMSHYSRGYPQQWTDRHDSSALDAGMAMSSRFGVSFLTLVDVYRQVERSTKYGILFIAMIFTTFFLFDVLASLKLHPFQYILVAAALCLFYLALLSLSEFIPFSVAYAIAALASTLLISLYCLKILASGAQTLIVTVIMAAVYGFLYIILQLQDYSLLVGTVGLFIALATVMYATRNINWYEGVRK